MFAVPPEIYLIIYQRVLQVNKTTALRMIDDFERLGIFKELTGYKRNRIFSFDKYLGLFKD